MACVWRLPTKVMGASHPNAKGAPAPKREGPIRHSPGDVTFMVRRNATPDTFTFSPGSHRCYHDAAHARAVVPLDLSNPANTDVPLDEEVHVALVAETLDAHLLRATAAQPAAYHQRPRLHRHATTAHTTAAMSAHTAMTNISRDSRIASMRYLHICGALSSDAQSAFTDSLPK